MYAFSWLVLNTCVLQIAMQYSNAVSHTPLSFLPGTLGYSLRFSSGVLSGDRQQDTQCSKLAQQLSSLPHLDSKGKRLQAERGGGIRVCREEGWGSRRQAR